MMQEALVMTDENKKLFKIIFTISSILSLIIFLGYSYYLLVFYDKNLLQKIETQNLEIYEIFLILISLIFLFSSIYSFFVAKNPEKFIKPKKKKQKIS